METALSSGTRRTVKRGTYLTDGTRLVWVSKATADGTVVLEVAGGLGPDYVPDEYARLIRQTRLEFKASHWRVVTPEAEEA